MRSVKVNAKRSGITSEGLLPSNGSSIAGNTEDESDAVFLYDRTHGTLNDKYVSPDHQNISKTEKMRN